MKRFAGGFALLAVLSACTSIGVSVGDGPAPHEFGPEMEICLCVYQDTGVSDETTQTILNAIREEFAPLGLAVRTPWIKPWKRPAFSQKGITRDVARRPLEAPCDRILAFVGRDARDFLWGALMPEILGAVETRTNTKGYVVAEVGSLNQVLTFESPSGAAVHEFYHLLGVRHGIDKEDAFAQVRRIKDLASRNRQIGRDFFPAMSAKGRIYTTRAAVDRRFGIAPPAHAVASGEKKIELVRTNEAASTGARD
jgi:hypothetical protein